MLVKTDYYDFLDNDDLTTTESYHSMILFDSTHKVFARQKACGNRTIFPTTTIYHPTDGNCHILIDDTPQGRQRAALHIIKPHLKFNWKRITTTNELEKAIKQYNASFMQTTQKEPIND